MATRKSAGAGKTKLVSIVVDDLLQKFEQLPNDEAFAYFYCDRNQSDLQNPTLILSSFVRQLSTLRNHGIPRSIVQMYDQKRQTAFASGTLKLKESQTLVADLFQTYPQITLVVDALDECDKNTRSEFIDILEKFVDESPNPIKIFISSRRDRDIEDRFKDGPSLGISATDNRDDIATYVRHEIPKFRRMKISPELEELVYNTLVRRSEGMFQRVSLQITMLLKFSRERDIRNRLEKLPQTLEEAYEELYLKIRSQEGSTPMIAYRAFHLSGS
ncbi:hypothetical protein MMC29_003680 [Sticta canariensis]|nr:hypothetical protein [Sticta canariensis]